MRRFGLTGFPLGHSFSAGYFDEKFRRLSISDAGYLNYPVSSAGKIRTLFENDSDLCGLNVTIPYKKEVLQYLDSLDESAEQAGAVNVIKAFRRGGRITLRGYNTDIYGFRESLPEGYRSGQGVALVLGTGGASQAVAYVLREAGYSTLRISREGGRGDLSYSLVSRGLIRQTRIIVNATPAGMFPDIDSAPPINYSMLSGREFLYDLVYNPSETKFMRQGRLRGCNCMNGLEMLHLQAEKAWEIWNETGLVSE